ncbi:hypothetical protein HDU77_010707 [Chytriomyces hyalinus]|nr:hypothetical protein HDU77_010707 [Chytriomyces hyalinus]
MDSNDTSSDTNTASDAHFSHFPSYNDWCAQQENQQATLEQYYDQLHAHGLLLQNDRKQPDEAFPVFEFLAKRGHAKGMNSYGIRLIDGNTPGGFRNPKEGLTWVEKSATLGFAKAKRNLAVYLSEGIVCEKNGEEALRSAYEAMNQGFADAYYTLGLMYLNGDVVPRDYFKAADFLQQGVDLGNIDCISSLGRQYLKGRGVAKNVPKALELFEKAIGLGHSKAEFYLGCVYAKGYDGVPKDYSKAIEYYERAAKAGVTGAIRNLGHCYEHGNGVPQNYEISLQHLTRAANSGDACALFYIGRKYQHGEGVPQDYIKAHEFFERAAEQKDKRAICNLGYLLSKGLGCTKDPVRATELFQQSAELGNGMGANNLGIVYLTGEGVPINLFKALDYFRKAVNLNFDRAKRAFRPTSGLTKALFTAGDAFRMEGNRREAIEYFKAAAQHGHTESVAELSKMYADALWGMDEVSFDAEMRFFTPPQIPDKTLSILPSELLTQIFSWLHPKQCILLRRTSHRMLAFFDTESFARHLLQVNALLLPSPVQKLENWFDKMLFHGPHAFQVAYIEARLNGLQIITGAEVKYASGSDCRMKEFPAAFVHWTSLTCLQLSRCELTGAIPGSIKYLRSLREVDLSHNRFDGTEIPATSIMELDNLEVLLLDACGLTGKVGLEFAAFLERLMRYSLGSNELEFETKFKPAKIEHVLG